VREQVEAGRLARAVRADERVDRSLADAQAHVLDGDEAFELLGELPCFENGVVGHAAPARARRTVPLRKIGALIMGDARTRWQCEVRLAFPARLALGDERAHAFGRIAPSMLAVMALPPIA
jgi:hypothetical protein